MLNRSILLALFALNAACGRGDDGGSEPVKAPVLSSATQAGLAFAAANVDQSIGASRVYYYDFAGGQVREVVADASGHPSVFFADQKLFVFGQQSVRVLDPRKSGGAPAAEAMPLTGLVAGDPWGVATLVPGQSVLLASALAGKLQQLDYATGVLADADVSFSGNAAGELRPRALLTAGASVHVLHTGLRLGSAQLAADGTQAVVSGTVGAGGSIALGARRAIQASNPSGFLNADGSSALVVGLCDAAAMPGCKAGADRYTPANGVVQSVAQLDPPAFPHAFFNAVVDGPTPTSVYAHVRSADGQHKVVRLDTATRSVTDVHLFKSDRLFGIAYDASSGTLFVGDQAGLKGKLTIYRNDAEIGTVELDGVPQSAALVSK